MKTRFKEIKISRYKDALKRIHRTNLKERKNIFLTHFSEPIYGELIFLKKIFAHSAQSVKA